MIPLNFYRDDEYVYYNNPNGITKKMTIAEFETIMSGDSVLPEYSSSSQGKVLSVDSDGDLEWASLPPDELPAYSSSDHGEVLSVDANGDLEWASLPPAELPAYTSSDGGKVLTVNSGGTGVEWGEGDGGSGSSIVGMAHVSSTNSEPVTVNSGNLASFFLTNYTFYDVNGSVVDDISYDWCAMIGYQSLGGGALIIKRVDANTGTIKVYNPTNGSLSDVAANYSIDILLFKIN